MADSNIDTKVYEDLVEALGTELLLTEIVRWFDYDTMNSCLQSIKSTWDLQP